MRGHLQGVRGDLNVPPKALQPLGVRVRVQRFDRREAVEVDLDILAMEPMWAVEVGFVREVIPLISRRPLPGKDTQEIRN